MSSANTPLVPDRAVAAIADYVLDYRVTSTEAYRIARYCTMDALGCALAALDFPACTKLLGPEFPGIEFPNGVRVPGTSLQLDPLSAAFNIATMIRWLDFNDALAARQGGHPSDSLGAILAVADYLNRRQSKDADAAPLKMRDVLTALIKAYEIQGVMSFENNFAKAGYDYVVLAKVAATAVVTQMLGGGRSEIINAVSNAWADGVPLTLYRQGKHTGTRKSWAGGDAASRAVRLAQMALQGEMGYPQVLSAKTFGFQDVFWEGQPLEFPRPYASYVIEHRLAFKFVPAGMQGQSAAECAFRLHPLVKDRIGDIASIHIRSHERMMRIMDKQGPLTNPADRDHCAQYIVAVALLHGKVDATDFEDDFAADPRIDELRAKMTVIEDPRYTREFHDPAKHTNAHAIEVLFKDGSRTPCIEVEHPSGHPPLGDAAFAMIEDKFRRHCERRIAAKPLAAILDTCADQARFEAMPVDTFMGLFAV